MNSMNLSHLLPYQTRSICPENRTGGKGMGARTPLAEGTAKAAARDLGDGWKVNPYLYVEPGEVLTLGEIEGSGVIRHIWLTPTGDWRSQILRIYWDDSDVPAVECPLGDFFACGWGQYAQFRRVNPLPYKQNYTILDGICGRGQYVGTYMAWGVNNTGWWGEGESKFYMDGDREYPTICGTGTEDYIGFAWGMDERCTPQSGCPYCDNEKGRYSIYRFHGKDPIYFQQGLKLTVQQIGCGSRKAVQAAFGDRADVYTAWGETDESDLCYYERSDDYCSTVYWYQTLPTPAFPKLPDRAARMADL